MDAESDTSFEFGGPQSPSGSRRHNSSQYQSLASTEPSATQPITKPAAKYTQDNGQSFSNTFEEAIESWSDTVSFAPASHISADSPNNLWPLGPSDASHPLVHKLGARWDIEITRATQDALVHPSSISNSRASTVSARSNDIMNLDSDDASDSDGLVPESPYTKRAKRHRPEPANTTERLFNPALAKVPSVWRVMWSFLGRDFGAAGMLSLLTNATLLVPFIALPTLMTYFQYGSDHTSAVRATALVVLSVISMALYALFKNQAAFLSARLAIHFSTALRGLLFSKSLRIKFKDLNSLVDDNSNEQASKEGSHDVPKSASRVAHFTLSVVPIIEHYLMHFHTLWTTPFIILASISFMWHHAGASTLAGLFVFLAFSILAQFFSMQAEEHDSDQLHRMHHRDNFLEELLTRFTEVKEQVVENFFEQLLKSHQLALSAPSIFSWCLSFIVSHSVAIFASVFTIVVDALIVGRAVTVEEFIVVTALFGLLQHYIKPYYSLVLHATKLRNIMDQIRMFLLEEETESFEQSNPAYACARHAVITRYYKQTAEIPLMHHKPADSDPDKDTDRYGGFYEPSSSMESSSSSSSESSLASLGNGNSAGGLSKSPSNSAILTSPFSTPKKLRPFGPSTDAIRIPDRFQIRMDHANFAWGGTGPKKPLKELTLQISRGALVIVLGGPGSGKSSLFKALLGEMTLLSGEVHIEGAVSYAPQIPWTLNESVRFNIAFASEPSDMPRYLRSLSMSGLKDDLEALQDGDATHLSDAYFSTAQLSRVSLARSIYRNVDTYLIDDLFYNFETPEKAHQIMETTLSGIGSATRILALSRHMPIIERANMVVYMKEGEISYAGSYQGLIENDPTFFDTLAVHERTRSFRAPRPMLRSALGNMTSGVTIPSPNKTRIKYDMNANLAELVGIDSSHIAGPHYQHNGLKFKSGARYYLKRNGMSIAWITLATFVSFILADLGRLLGLGLWLENHNILFPTVPTYTASEWRSRQFAGIASFSLLSVASAGLLFGLFWTFSGGSHAATNKIWFALVDTVLRWPLSVIRRSEGSRLAALVGFEAHRFQAVLPRQMHETLYQLISFFRFGLSSVAASPLSVLVSLPMMFVGFRFHLSLHPTISGLSQYTTLEAGFLTSYYENVMEGVETIRAFEAESRFTTAYLWRQDEANKARLASLLLSHYTNMRLTLIAAVILMGVCICAIFLSFFGFSSSIMFGMAFIYSVHLCETLPSLFYHGTRLVTFIHALFNVKNVIAHSPAEEPWKDDAKDPRSVWPSKGTVTFSHITLRREDYADMDVDDHDNDKDDGDDNGNEDGGLERAQCYLWDFSATFAGGTKIALCGPKRSGVSGISKALLRFIDPEKRSSNLASIGRVKISIDEQSIHQLGLHTVRETISVISPQLFSMTIAEYLGEVEELQMWQALEKVGIKDKISFTDSKLHTLLMSESLQLTFAERLLLSMAKALCRKTQIVLFREPKTEMSKADTNAVKDALFSCFNKHTLIVAAYTQAFLDGVDVVFVMSHGAIVQQGSVATLRQQATNSPFNRLFSRQEEEVIEKELEAAERGNLIDL